MWKVYEKGNKPGWACLIPIYNLVVLLEMIDLPTIYILYSLIPFFNIYIVFKIYITLAKKFGQSEGFGVGLALLPCIFFPILGFGKYTFLGSNDASQNQNNPTNNAFSGLNTTSKPFEPNNNPNNPNNNYFGEQNFQNNLGTTTPVNIAATVEQPQVNTSPINMDSTVSEPQNIVNNPTNVIPNPTFIPNDINTQNPNPEPIPNNGVNNATPQNVVEPVNQDFKFCPQCGAKVAKMSSICPQCGTYLN